MFIQHRRGLGRTRSAPIVLLGAMALVVAACGGSPAAMSSPTVAAAAPASPSTEASAAAPSASVATVEVGKEAWFAGFHVTFGTATASVEPGEGGDVSIAARFENTGAEDARLDATITLVSAGETAQEGMAQDIPSVPGGQTGKGTFAFRVEDSFSFEDAVLTLGRPDNQQAVIPLGGAASATTLEPTEVTAAGTGKANDLQLDVTGGELRADKPWNHDQAKKGVLVLTVAYSATFNSGFAGGFAFTAENVALKGPDGTTVGVIQDGESQSIELIGPNTTKKDLFSRFEIDDPAPGQYVFLVREGTATGEIPFTIR
jgi:hypothetical protein